MRYSTPLQPTAVSLSLSATIVRLRRKASLLLRLLLRCLSLVVAQNSSTTAEYRAAVVPDMSCVRNTFKPVCGSMSFYSSANVLAGHRINTHNFSMIDSFTVKTLTNNLTTYSSFSCFILTDLTLKHVKLYICFRNSKV